MRCFKKITFIGWICFLWAAVSFAEQISVTAQVDNAQVPLGSSVRFALTVNGTQDISPVQLPALDGFLAQYLGPSRSIQIVNGAVSKSVTFNYSLLPQKVGQFIIPPIEVTVDGQKYTTQSISLEVTDSGQQAISSDQPSNTATLQDRIFLAVKVPKTEVYVNEPLPVKVMLFVSDISIADVQFPKLESLGFTLNDFGQPQQYQQVINGRRFDIVEFDTVIYPTRVGEVTVGPGKLECNLLVKNGNQRPGFGNFGSVFDDPFFDNFFNHFEKRPVTLSSPPTVLNVLPLPDEGKPGEFTGAVGTFQFEASVSPIKVKEGDPITLRMKIQGEGNLAAAEFPKLAENDQIKLYDPNIKEEGGTKTFEQVVIPKTHELREVPALNFAYFDPNIKKYQTVTRGPFPVEVEKLSGSERLQVIGSNQPALAVNKPEKLGQDIVFIKEDVGDLKKRGDQVFEKLSYVVFVFLIIVAWAAMYIFYKRTHRLETDTAYAKAFLAPRQAKAGLIKAGELLKAKKKEEFYDTLFKTFQLYLSNKFHLSIGNVTLEILKHKIDGALKEESILKEVKAIFDEAEMIRYASANMDEGQMAESLQRVEKVIDYLERAKR